MALSLLHPALSLSTLDQYMVLVEGGAFDMGGGSGLFSAKPIHRVQVDDFFLCRFPVSQSLWRELMGSAPEELFFAGAGRPAERVSWHDCQQFLQALNARSPHPYRLPTEAEWEYVAREGAYARGYAYAGSDDLSEVGWYAENSFDETQVVGLRRPNALGLYDLSGNVWEWCQDWYDADYYATCARQGTVHNPTGPESAVYRVYRGGSWNNSAVYARLANRDYWRPGSRRINRGFRLARSH